MKKLMLSSAGLVLIALAFLAFNLFAGLGLSNARLDLTEQKLYTLTDFLIVRRTLQSAQHGAPRLRAIACQ
jgi:ABC-type uncharacterized transport system involved in gliding motility auxiliary subunit